MIQIGDYNTLPVVRLAKGGCYLDGGDYGEFYLSKKDTPNDVRPGQTLRVFIYNDSKEKLGATTREPFAKVGDFAPLVVTSVADFGLFLEWGISKDLFVPRKHLPNKEKPKNENALRRGDILVVYLLLDYEKMGVIGTTHLASHFDSDISSLESNQEVEILVYEKSKLGALVVIDNRWDGLLYHGEIFEPIKIGERKTGYIKKLREDGKVDVALQPQGVIPATEKAKDTILTALGKENGYIPLHDKSSPDEIYRKLEMSKKLFKKSIGMLYKEGKISIKNDGIFLKGE